MLSTCANTVPAAYTRCNGSPPLLLQVPKWPKLSDVSNDYSFHVAERPNMLDDSATSIYIDKEKCIK